MLKISTHNENFLLHGSCPIIDPSVVVIYKKITKYRDVGVLASADCCQDVKNGTDPCFKVLYKDHKHFFYRSCLSSTPTQANQLCSTTAYA